jgi:hypothetical protein
MLEMVPGHQNLILERRGIDQLLAFVFVEAIGNEGALRWRSIRRLCVARTKNISFILHVGCLAITFEAKIRPSAGYLRPTFDVLRFVRQADSPDKPRPEPFIVKINLHALSVLQAHLTHLKAHLWDKVQ